MPRQVIRRTVVILAALAAGALLAAEGCVVILPPFPKPVPGYGQVYEVVDHEGRPVALAGSLVLISDWRSVRDFPVESGRVAVPPRSDCYSAGMPLGVIFCPIPFGYVGEFRPYVESQLLVLVPGFVPRDFKEDGGGWYHHEHGEPLGMEWQRPGDRFWIGPDEAPLARLTMRQAPQDVETLYLEYVRTHILIGDTQVLSEPRDKAALDRARQYVAERVKALAAAEGRQRPLGPAP